MARECKIIKVRDNNLIVASFVMCERNVRERTFGYIHLFCWFVREHDRFFANAVTRGVRFNRFLEEMLQLIYFITEKCAVSPVSTSVLSTIFSN